MAQWTDFFKGENLPSALMVLVLMVSLIGGLGLLAVGLGLQGERPGSGRAAMVASALMVASYSILAAVHVIVLGRFLTGAVVLLLSLVGVFLFLVAGHSASVLKKNPPPDDLNVATPEILEEFRQKRLERLKHYEP